MAAEDGFHISRDLDWADLRGADFSETQLQEADLRGGDLRKAKLSAEDLCRSNLITVSLDS